MQLNQIWLINALITRENLWQEKIVGTKFTVPAEIENSQHKMVVGNNYYPIMLKLSTQELWNVKEWIGPFFLPYLQPKWIRMPKRILENRIKITFYLLFSKSF